MVTRLTNLALCLVLIAMDAAGIERRTSEMVKVQVRISDVNGRSLNDLRPDDFVLGVDDSGGQFIIPHTRFLSKEFAADQPGRT
jgi:hypothetical protein